ncbi:MAG: Regulatory protein TetR [Frondihabitans sp.]|nr:Regulatory protein TetR [Frondihabitans sp.]
MPAPRRSLAQTREALVDAAIRVIAARGLAAASTRVITAEAGVPLSAFHYAFDSTDHLLDRVIERVLDGERAVGVSALESEGDEPAGLGAMVRHGFEQYLDLLIARPEHEQAMLELTAHMLRTPGREHVAREQYLAYYAAAEVALEHAATRAKTDWMVPVGEVARLTVLLMDGLTMTWLADRDTEGARAAVTFAAASIAGLARSSGEDTARNDAVVSGRA